MVMKNHFHNKGFALGLVLELRLAASRKWPIFDVLVLQQVSEVPRKRRLCGLHVSTGSKTRP